MPRMTEPKALSSIDRYWIRKQPEIRDLDPETDVRLLTQLD